MLVSRVGIPADWVLTPLSTPRRAGGIWDDQCESNASHDHTGSVTDGTDADDEASTTKEVATPPPGTHVALRSLAPEYLDDHSAYVKHLEDAIKDSRNRNIALTGRYGSGKSSVLDQFQKNHKSTTLRISINTLGPDGSREDLTNRIQKELVKQLIYRAEPGKLRRSRFARTRPLTPLRALGQAVVATAVMVVLLWLVGIRPPESWFGGAPLAAYWGWFAAAFVLLTVIVVWWVRLFVGDRTVSQVSTAGTSITLGDKPETYFDGFLDEIVTFFEAVNPQFVIFEDLDRFDDPRIFDSLRELNTLINESAHWKAKKARKGPKWLESEPDPLRFIYAIKDSLFEKLGADPDSDDGHDQDKDSVASDAGVPVDTTPVASPSSGPVGSPALDKGLAKTNDVAAAAVERANRTKFFELVIPMVPFISHRNARDHLVDALAKLDLPSDIVSRPLVDLVARHVTDMRLLINICNEFVVFAERLLWTDRPAPGLTGDDLFALVVYKNFHLADFESIPQRASTLDALERHGRDLVRESIENLQQLRREPVHTEERRQHRDGTAEGLGTRLHAFSKSLPHGVRRYDTYVVDGEAYAEGAISTAAFWQQVASTGWLEVTGANVQTVRVEGDSLIGLFPEIANVAWWAPAGAAEIARQVRRYDADIATLRGADFNDLARFDRYPKGATTFSTRIETVLKSELARELVRQGFLSRNYAEYSAVFYGSFVGVDVAFFFNHSVQPNEMYLDYEFKTPNAIRNLLEQVPTDFTSTVSAFNVQVASFLVKERPEDARRLVKFLATEHGADAKTFLDTFLNTAAAPREQFIGLLAAHPWHGLFDYLVEHPGMPDEDTRRRFIDTALQHATDAEEYELAEATRVWLASRYRELRAFAEPQGPEQTAFIFAIAHAAGVHVADLGDVAPGLRRLFVDWDMYDITSNNLRLALDIAGPPLLDEVRKNGKVWDYCRVNMNAYLAAVTAEDALEYVVQDETVLVEIINEQHESWIEEQLAAVLEATSPEAAIRDLTRVPQSTWPAVADADAMIATVANIRSYTDALGLDGHLAQFLCPDAENTVEMQDIDLVEDDDRDALAARILNVPEVLLPASARVQLAVELQPTGPIDAKRITPAEDNLLAWALEAELVPDTEESFIHFSSAGWGAIAGAFAVSDRVEEFFGPALLHGFAGDFLQGDEVPDRLRRTVVEDLSAYVDDDDTEGLEAAGSFARAKRVKLPLDEVRRIARVTSTPDLVMALLVPHKDVSPEDVIATLALLGQPYSLLQAGPGASFKLPTGSSARTLFQRLQESGRVRIVSGRFGAGKKVQVVA